MGIHILVVDDEAPIAELVAVYLQNEGYSVYTCGTGQEALDYVNQARVDLAVLDVMLPDLDGFSVCRKLRRSIPWNWSRGSRPSFGALCATTRLRIRRAMN